MVVKRLQNKIAESRMTLSFTAVYAVLVFLASGLVGKNLWFEFACLAVSTYLMVEFNNVNALLRVYSRMISCAFLVLACAANYLFASPSAALVQACFAAFYLIVFNAYQERTASGVTFYAYLFIGVASTVFVQILFFVPLLWILHATNVLSMSWRNFWASVLGLIAPYWFVGAYLVYTGQPEVFVQHFTHLALFAPLFQYQEIDHNRIATFLFVALVSLIGIIHYLRSSRNDKIRNRMIYEMVIVVDLFTIACIVLQPQHADNLLPILIINTAALIAHFITLTRTAATNIVFCVLLLASVLLTVCNLWIPL